MANNNFIPWLGSGSLATTPTNQQKNYNAVVGTGFSAGGLVKAEDFNAALRMTTLVCAGIASAFGFDSKTINESEDEIAKAIKNPTFSDISITGQIKGTNIKFEGDITANTITGTGELSGLSLTINKTERISRYGVFIAEGYHIDNTTVIDDNTNITGISVRTNDLKINVNNKGYKSIFDLIYPVGSIYMSVNNVSPADIWGGIWERWGQGRVPVSVDINGTVDGAFADVELTGGRSTARLTTDNMPSHNHTFQTTFKEWDAPRYPITQIALSDEKSAGAGPTTLQTSTQYSTDYTGDGIPFDILQPYITCYMWKRKS